MRWLRRWLERPQKTNRDALIVGVVGGVLVFAVGELLGLVKLLDFAGEIPAWVLAPVAGVALAAGVIAGRVASGAGALADQVGALEARTDELAGYELYAEHLRDALADLRRFLSGDLPNFSLGDYVENGIFQPAHRLLTRDGRRGDVRFSILMRHEGEFRMASDDSLYPALGHSAEGRQNFRLSIDDSFAGIALRTESVQHSNDTDTDDRFKMHPKARPERAYRSIVSVPITAAYERPNGVMNIVATAPEAFNGVDRTYVSLLAAVVDVASAALHKQSPDPSNQPSE